MNIILYTYEKKNSLQERFSPTHDRRTGMMSLSCVHNNLVACLTLLSPALSRTPPLPLPRRNVPVHNIGLVLLWLWSCKVGRPERVWTMKIPWLWPWFSWYIILHRGLPMSVDDGTYDFFPQKVLKILFFCHRIKVDLIFSAYRRTNK